jgi:hypothetical protein
MIRRCAAPSLLALVALTVGAGGTAAAAGTVFTAEGTVGPGWRVALDQSDRAPGFQALSGGVEVLAGVGFGALGVVAGARFRGGSESGPLYLELDGALAMQIFLGERARARIGAEAGWSHLPGLDVPLVGGFLALSLDLASFAGGRAALCLAIELEMDTFVTAHEELPTGSAALSGGVGFRY